VVREIDAEEAAFRVTLGEVWLDRNAPGWIDRIDLSRLDMSERGCCVLGQIYGSCDKAPEELLAGEPLNGADYPGHRMVQYGFDLPAYGWEDPDPEDFAALEAEWRRVIEERRAQAGTHGSGRFG
jgi:hypothetical protein